MPNRILKESICTSATLDRLTAEAEVLFYRLMVQCDDYGRFFAHPGIVRGHCFPRKTDLDLKAVSSWLDRLEQMGLIVRYEVAGDPYLAMVTWEKHQQTRAKRSKYPEPPPTPGVRANSIAPDSTRNQMIADDSPEELSGKQMSPYPVSNPESISGIDTRLTGGAGGNGSVVNGSAASAAGSPEWLGDEASDSGTVETTPDNGHASASEIDDPVDEVYAAFKASIQPGSRVCPRKKIASRLKKFSVAELRLGIANFAADPWRMENNVGGGYNAEWFFKSDEQVEKWRDLVPKKATTSTNGRENAHSDRTPELWPTPRRIGRNGWQG